MRLQHLLLCLLPALLSAAPVKFDIAPQSADLALQRFAQQASVEVAYPAAELRQVQSNALQGEFEPLAGLERLLSGSGYTPRQLSATSYAVSRPPAPKPGSIDGSIRDEAGKPVAGAKVTLADSDKAVATDKRGRFLLTDVVAGAHVLQITAEGLQSTRVTDVVVKSGQQHSLSPITIPVRKEGTLQLEDFVVSAKKNDGVVELDPYAVEGQRPKPFTTASLDLTRTRDDILPFNTFSAKDIELSGASNIEEFLRMRLPQFVTDTLPEETNSTLSSAFASKNQLNLRGWGSGLGNAAQETVILINGRRVPGRFVEASTDSAMIQGEFRGIPIGAIERVEILSSAGSAIYGGNATAGVINIIMRKDYRGGQVTLNYENPWDAHAPKRSADLNYGWTLGNGFNVRLTAGVSDRVPLNLEDRAEETIGRWQRIVFERDPARLLARVAANPLNTTTLPPIGATPNLRALGSTTTGNLFGPGTPNFTSVPPGYAGGAGLAPFLAQQGIYNFALAEGALDSSRSLQAALGTTSHSKSFSLAVDKSFWKNIQLSLDYSYTETTNGGTGGYFETGLGLLVVPATAPTNPFGTSVVINFDDPRMQRPEIDRFSTNSTQVLSATIHAQHGEWSGIADFAYSADKERHVAESFFSPIGGWQNAFLTRAYNPFVDMRVAAPAAPSFYEEFVIADLGGDSAANSKQASAKISGPLLKLPAGPMMLTAGLEWSRQDRTTGRVSRTYRNSRTGADVPLIAGDPSRAGGDLPVTPVNLLFSFENYAGYAESLIPAISPKQHVPLVRMFEVFGSARYDYSLRNGYMADGRPIEYQTSPNTRAFGAKHVLVKGVSLRASRSIGFRPATLADVTPRDPQTTNTNVIDRRRSNETKTLTPGQYITGGNPDLKPMTTTSTNYGLIFQPKPIPGMRISLDYVESVREDVIATLTPQQTIDLEADLPDRVQRGIPDGHASGVGPITFVDARNINFRQMASKSLDLTFEHQVERFLGGRVFISASATKLISFKVQTTNTAPAVEQVKNPLAAFSRSVQWNGNAQVRWERKQWSVGWNGRYYDEVLALPADYVVMGTDRAKRALEHDVVLGYRIHDYEQARGFKGLLKNTAITLGIKNFLGRKPRFWAASSLGYLPQDSIVGRSVWVQIRKSL